MTFLYTEENKVLEDVTFTIPYGKTTALVGDNGSGKLTILKLIQGFYSPESGNIYIGESDIADTHDFIKELPNGYHTDIGEAGSRLSGGQRQKIAIARVLMQNPEYLLLDEAGASLDHQSDYRIYQSLKSHMKGKTIVVIAHDMAEVMEADQIIVLNKGKVEAIGTHEQLLESSVTYQSYIDKQKKGEVIS